MKTTYWLPCPCGQKLPVKTTQAGQTVHCTCGTELTVPTLHQMLNLELVESREVIPSRFVKAAWDKRQSRIFLVAVFTSFSLALLAYLEISKPRPPQMESLAPIQVWYLWQNLRRGPDRHLVPPEKQFLADLRINRRMRTGMVVCTAAGLLMLAVFYAIPAPRTPRRVIRGRTTSQTPLTGETPNAHL